MKGLHEYLASARSIETAEIQREEQIAITGQKKQIAIAQKSREESEAAAEADRARALAVEAQEGVVTVREKAQADRSKAIELIEAAKAAEREAIGLTVAAEAEKRAAQDQAQAVQTLAEGKAGEARISATGDADAEKLRVEAAEKRYAVEAAGKRALNEAENLLTSEIIAMRIKLALIENLEQIVRESVKPIAAIDGIKIIQVEGLGPHAAGAGNGDGSGVGLGAGGNLADQAVNAALRYRAQAPLLDSLLREIGIDGGDINGLVSPLQADPLAKPPVSAAQADVPAKPAGTPEARA